MHSSVIAFAALKDRLTFRAHLLPGRVIIGTCFASALGCCATFHAQHEHTGLEAACLL